MQTLNQPHPCVELARTLGPELPVQGAQARLGTSGPSRVALSVINSAQHKMHESIFAPQFSTTTAGGGSKFSTTTALDSEVAGIKAAIAAAKAKSVTG